MTYNYCTFKKDAEHVCRYPEGFTPGGDETAEHILITDPGYQQWLAAHPAGAPMYDDPGQPWAPSAPPEPPTAIEKLAAAGLTVEELKALLVS